MGKEGNLGKRDPINKTFIQLIRTREEIEDR
jgi:hypothetical protein